MRLESAGEGEGKYEQTKKAQRKPLSVTTKGMNQLQFGCYRNHYFAFSGNTRNIGESIQQSIELRKLTYPSSNIHREMCGVFEN